MSGTTELQEAAQRKRASWIVGNNHHQTHSVNNNKSQRGLPRNVFIKFREPGFVYLGDTVVIWNIHEYLANPKWKEDALRKSMKRKERNIPTIQQSDRLKKQLEYDNNFTKSAYFNPRATKKQRRRKDFAQFWEEIYQRSLLPQPETNHAEEEEEDESK